MTAFLQMIPVLFLFFLVVGFLTAAVIYLMYLCIKALRKYIGSSRVREEKQQTKRSLGEVLKKHRMELGFTQEFVAESLGVSRQAVSKWEVGASDPSTSNLFALAKLFGITPEELIREIE